MGFFSRRTSTGVFVPTGNGFKELETTPEKGSINDISFFLGYNTDQFYSYSFGSKSKIVCIVFEIFTRNIIYILTDKEVTFVTEKDVKKYLSGFSVAQEFDCLRIKDVLEAGIENETLTIEYLSKVLKISNVSRNGMFYSAKIKTYLYITNGILTNYQYDNGFFPWAKHLKEVNSTIYNKIYSAAILYRGQDTFEAQKEINIQSEAWSSIPEAYGNEFVRLHEYGSGFVNLHMLRVCHYSYPINKEQFEEINHGRYVKLEDDNLSKSVIYKCGLFEYSFSESGELEKFNIIN